MNYIIQVAVLEEEKMEITKFLESIDLKYEDVDYTLYIKDDSQIVGTISSKNNLIKCLGVASTHQGLSISNILLTELLRFLNNKGIHHYFVYTTTNNKKVFNSFGFQLLVEYKDVCLLEAGLSNIKEYLKDLKKTYNLSNRKKACIVMNLNPLTNGHLYLIEEVSKNNDEVILFIVSEDHSIFPFKDRSNILKQAIQHLNNVIIIPTGDYIISQLTFPTYFIKDQQIVEDVYNNMDVLLFKEYIMPQLNISKRYVGTEPYCLVTNHYNETLKKHLGNDLVVLKRKVDPTLQLPISATMVRKKIKEHQIEQIKDLVPKATYNYIKENYNELLEKMNDQ